MQQLKISALAISILMVFMPFQTQAQQYDAPYYQSEKVNKSKWAAEDKEIKQKLAALEKKFGKRPNIIYILADDVGWGELGWQGGGKHRGTPTPELDKLAMEGMRFWAAYAEPSCTPTRIAINTGRHPVRTGLLSVLWPGQSEGLSPEEVTVAEVLSEAGTTRPSGASGTWRRPEQAPENQGYDYAYYGLWNGAPTAGRTPPNVQRRQTSPRRHGTISPEGRSTRDGPESTSRRQNMRDRRARAASRLRAPRRVGQERQEGSRTESIGRSSDYVKTKRSEAVLHLLADLHPAGAGRRPTTTRACRQGE